MLVTPSGLPLSIKAPQQLFILINIRVEWFYIYTGICSHQKGGDIEKICFEDLLIQSTGDSEDTEDFDKYKIENFPPFFSAYNSKDTNKYILIKIYTFINMYKALKIGWKEIYHLYPKQTYNTLFLELLIAYYSDKFTRQCNLQKPCHKINVAKITAIKNFSSFAISQIERLIEEEKPDSLEQKLYKSILEEYSRVPYGQSLDKVLDILKKASKKDIYLERVKELL